MKRPLRIYYTEANKALMWGRWQARCDSFVVETNVHYPTDINLLLEVGARKALQSGSKDGNSGN